MIVYAESNFILEYALLQEQHEACSEILDLAEAGRIALVIPAFSVAEPYDVLRRRAADRLRLQDDVGRHLRLVSRTALNEQQLQNAADVTAMLVESGKQEMSRLHDLLVRMLAISEVIAVTADVLTEAIGAQERLGLKPPDSIIYASVVSHATNAGGSKCFINRDARDFLTPDIEEKLRSLDCKLVTSFVGGLGYIRAALD